MKLKHAIFAATMCVATLLAAVPFEGTCDQGAPAPSPSDTVYVTASGKKYHRQDCRYAKTATPMTREQAEAKGLTPCKVCKP